MKVSNGIYQHSRVTKVGVLSMQLFSSNSNLLGSFSTPTATAHFHRRCAFVVSPCSSAVISDNSFSPPFFSLLVYSDSRVILSSIRFCFWHVHVADLLLCFKQNNFVEILIFQEISICHVNK